MNLIKNINKVLEASNIEAPRTNKKGISLLSLIITIIIIVILAGVIISTFLGTTQDKATSARVLNEFIEVENAVSQRGKEHKLDSAVYPYIGIPLDESTGITIQDKLYGPGFYLLEQQHLSKLGITGSVKNYIVNYETGEVLLEEPYIIAQRTIYRKHELIDEETDNSVTGAADYNEEKGVNKPVLFTGMVPVKYVSGAWVVTDVDDPEWYDYAITGSGPIRYANVMLLDDLKLREGNSDYSNTTVRGMSLNAMKGMTVTSEGSMFIWIPRYTYKKDGDSTEIVYSRLYNDYTLNGFVRSPAFYNGEYVGASATDSNDGYVAGGRELSGIWISKYEASYGQ